MTTSNEAIIIAEQYLIDLGLYDIVSDPNGPSRDVVSEDEGGSWLIHWPFSSSDAVGGEPFIRVYKDTGDVQALDFTQ